MYANTSAPRPGPGPGARQLFGIWAGIGLQSFGGGASTNLLIQRTFIERRRWLSIEEFTRLWNLCQLTPGINLIAVTILIGKKLGGTRGIVASLAGLLLPSAAITCLLAAVFLRVEHAAVVKEVLRGVVPATAGIMAMVTVNFMRPLIRDRHSVGRFYLWAAGALAIVLALAIIALNISAIVVVLSAAGLGVLFFAPRTKPPLRDERKTGGR
ncbi:MAG: chromate transporter [Ktedonobacterales bacterium]